MISQLPLEIQVVLLKLSPGSSLKLVNSHFYLLYNDLFYDKLLRTFGDDVTTVIRKVYPWLRTYIKSLDSFRYACRQIIASRLCLKDLADTTELQDVNSVIQSMYIKDSWKYVFSLFKNKRLFAEYTDYKIDEPTNYIYNHYVEINRTYLLSYTKTIWLAPGQYNLNIGLVVKHGSGLGTTKFEVKYDTKEGESFVQTYYPPSNINDILPKKQFCFLKVGEFCIPDLTLVSSANAESANHHNKLHKVQFTMEEIGLYLKSGFRIFFIDISQPSMLFNDYDLLYYSCQETDYKYFINLPLKNFYKALNHVQSNGNDDYDSKLIYGEGDPTSISDEYDFKFETSIEATSPQKPEDQLKEYADFYFKNMDNQRYFKFNTVYQRRQFINRFGDFDLDYSDKMHGEQSNQKYCKYDSDGLKWRIPIVGEL